MWTVSATQMVARLTSSTLFVNPHLVSAIASDSRPMATSSASTTTSAEAAKKSNSVINRMRDLRVRSPYAAFVKDNYHDISAQYPALKMADVSKKVAALWKSLSDDKKQGYVKKAQDQRATYEQEKQRLSASDLQMITADEKARRIQQRVKKSIQQLPTKRPRSAFIHFLSSLDRGEADLKDFMKGAAQKWAQMTVQDKQKYGDMHEEEKLAYVKSLVAWDAANAPVQKKVASEKPAAKKTSSSRSPSPKSPKPPKSPKTKAKTDRAQ